MRVSLRWLQELVDVDVAPDKLAELLDLSGTKVESIRGPQTDVHGVVVAEVLEIKEHPNADNLTLVDVSTGSGRTAHVVCGARNFKVGDRVPFAQVGARLGSVDLDITERKIRGQVSQGMLCSASELGVSRDHSGILVLSPDAALGEQVQPLLGLDDTIFELEITPNRPDCMSVLGIAREIAVLLDKELKMPDPGAPGSSDVGSPVQVRIEDAEGCPRYVARYISGITPGPSPTWMATRLLASGVRPISNVVDVTNYVMLELGQPLHAFDAAKVHDGRIVVRRARRDERLRTLDGVERALHPDDLVIADPKRALAIAGVMGGEDSEVGDDTSAVILESAYFSPSSVAFTMRRHLMRTEASARFERGADPELPPYAASRAAALIAEVTGGTASADVHDENPVRFERPVVRLRPERVARVLGSGVSRESQIAFLAALGFGVAGDDALDVTVPGFRPDVRIEADLIEEIARIAGFERLTATLPPGKAGGLDADQVLDRALRRTLAALGLTEAWTSSFMSAEALRALGIGSEGAAARAVTLTNPVTEDEALLRTTLLPGLLRSVALNVAHRSRGTALFEIARIYEPSDEDLPQEAAVLAAVVQGERSASSWNQTDVPWDLFGLKGVVEALATSVGVPRLTFAPVSGMPFHPTRAATMEAGDQVLGVIGELHPDVCEAFAVPEGTCAFEIGVAAFSAAIERRDAVHDVARFPGLFIDLAVVVDESVPAERVRSIIEEAGRPEVVDVRLFDMYRGSQVPEGKRSLAYALELRSPERTLTDPEAAAVRDRLVARLRDEVGGELRG